MSKHQKVAEAQHPQQPENISLQGADTIRLVVALERAANQAEARGERAKHAALNNLTVRVGALIAEADAVLPLLDGNDAALVKALRSSL